MNLERDFYRQAAEIDWLAKAEPIEPTDFPFPCSWVADRGDALTSLFSAHWADATTVAQGELTGFLSKYHNREYGAVWNVLAKESRLLVETAISAKLLERLKQPDWQTALTSLELPSVDRPLRASLGVQLADLLGRGDRHGAMRWQILINMNRAALEKSYRARFPKVPVFFERLFEIYAAGRLPCGWEGDLNQWPKGRLIVH